MKDKNEIWKYENKNFILASELERLIKQKTWMKKKLKEYKWEVELAKKYDNDSEIADCEKDVKKQIKLIKENAIKIECYLDKIELVDEILSMKRAMNNGTIDCVGNVFMRMFDIVESEVLQSYVDRSVIGKTFKNDYSKMNKKEFNVWVDRMRYLFTNHHTVRGTAIDEMIKGYNHLYKTKYDSIDSFRDIVIFGENNLT